jgi:hypothetical protein
VFTARYGLDLYIQFVILSVVYIYFPPVLFHGPPIQPATFIHTRRSSQRPKSEAARPPSTARTHNSNHVRLNTAANLDVLLVGAKCFSLRPQK